MSRQPPKGYIVDSGQGSKMGRSNQSKGPSLKQQEWKSTNTKASKKSTFDDYKAETERRINRP